MSTERDPETDQQLPELNDQPVMQQLIITEVMQKSMDVGFRKYGARGVQPFNGRDPLIDLEDELRDALVYVRQARYERDHLPITPGLELLRDELARLLCVETYSNVPAETALAENYEPDPSSWRFRAEELIDGPLADALSLIRREGSTGSQGRQDG